MPFELFLIIIIFYRVESLIFWGENFHIFWFEKHDFEIFKWFCWNYVPLEWNYLMTLHSFWIEFNLLIWIEFKLNVIQFKIELWVIAHYYWQSTNIGKNVLILWKLNSIQMKVLNSIACNLNWIYIELKFLKLIKFPKFNSNSIELNSSYTKITWHPWLVISY